MFDSNTVILAVFVLWGHKPINDEVITESLNHLITQHYRSY